MALMRIITVVTLVTAILGSSFGLAAARGQAHPVESIVICVGQGVQVLHLDADGNPTGPAYICPDGLFAHTALTDSAVRMPMPPFSAPRKAFAYHVAIWNGRSHFAASARDPPVLF